MGGDQEKEGLMDMPFRKRYRHFNRYREIANTLARHGFGYLLDQLGLADYIPYRQRFRKAAQPVERPSRGARLRLALEELGPTFVKLGQILSTRPDLVPKDILQELEKLQDSVPPFPFEVVKEQIEAEMGMPLERIFPGFDREPLAAASIGQVHRAQLADDREVVVKVQRPGIRSMIETDLEILFDLARLADKRTSWGQMYSFGDMVEEFARTISEEMDYTAEGRNAERFYQEFAGESSVYIPRVYWPQTTGKILTLEYVNGIKLNDYKLQEDNGQGRRLIARRLSQALLKQILLDGFFHADPHPGNIAILPGEVIAFMDFGMVGRLTEERKREFIALVLGLARRDSQQIVRAVMEMGIIPGKFQVKELRKEIERLRDRYIHVPMSQVSLGDAINEILNLAFRYRIRIPTELTLLAKALLTLEGIVQELDPELSIIGLAEPFGKVLISRQLSMNELKRAASEGFLEYGHILAEMPRQVHEILAKLASDQVTFRVEVQELDGIFSKLDRIVNRLSFSLVLMSFSIVMAGLVVASALVNPAGVLLLWRLPMLEVGLAAVTLMVIWLLYSILRSGRF
ncbi:MAG: ABC1 kinase family protein [Bacillota bacterium]